VELAVEVETFDVKSFRVVRPSLERTLARRKRREIKMDHIMSAPCELTAQLHLKGMPYVIVDCDAQSKVPGKLASGCAAYAGPANRQLVPRAARNDR
jgi:hypothetical protein